MHKAKSESHCKNAAESKVERKLHEMVCGWTESDRIEYSKAFMEGRVTLDGFADFMKNEKGIDVKEEELDEFKAKLRGKCYELNPGRKAANDLEPRGSDIFDSAIQQVSGPSSRYS